MENRDNKTPESGHETDISKSQAGPQPSAENRQQQQGQSPQSETSQGGQQGQPGFGGPDQQTSQPGHDSSSGQQGDTATQQRGDIEGTSGQTPEKGEVESGFIGTEGSSDTSSELVEDQDYAKDGQGAPEGK